MDSLGSLLLSHALTLSCVSFVSLRVAAAQDNVWADETTEPMLWAEQANPLADDAQEFGLFLNKWKMTALFENHKLGIR
jgi:hypothetical protein